MLQWQYIPAKQDFYFLSPEGLATARTNGETENKPRTSPTEKLGVNTAKAVGEIAQQRFNRWRISMGLVRGKTY